MPNTAPRRWIGMFSGFSPKPLSEVSGRISPAAIVEAVEPDVDRPGRAGVPVNYIGRIELDLRAVARQGLHIGLPGEIRCQALGEAAIEFDRRHPTSLAHHVREDRRVVADPGADMHDML